MESQTCEFKQTWKDEYLKTICAFANSDGGISININNITELIEKLPNKINNRLGLLIDLIVEKINENEIIRIKVEKTYAPVSFNGKFYQRSGSNTIELNGGNLTNFLLKKYGKTWDDIVIENFSIDDINLDTVEKFKIWTRKRASFIEEEKDLMTLFERLNLLENGQFKRAAILLFGKNPQKYFIQSHSKIGKFLSDSELLTSDIIEGNLFEQLEKIIDILRTKYLHSYISYEGIQRIETLEYPYEAVREAVINALIHRDYTDTTVLQIRVYNNKIVFSNGATLSKEVPIDKFKENHISKPFNPIIANMFYKAGFVESWGKGTNNIVDDCLKMGLPEPEYKYTFQSVQVIFNKNDLNDQATEQAILNFCIEPKNTSEIMEFLNLKHREHFRSAILKPMIEKGLLELTIPDKPKSPNQKYKTSRSN
ncbi:Fic family protein [Arcobacter arenosus]|uniref:Fic family protein n=1 Tax=Arcobacter arenosus TaxID=2576037 RepID=UPI003BA8FEAC